MVLRLRSELDRLEAIARAADGHRLRLATDRPQSKAAIELMKFHESAHVLRTIQAHRAILDRHANTWHCDVQWMCRKCGNAGAPCRDVREQRRQHALWCSAMTYAERGERVSGDAVLTRADSFLAWLDRP